MVACKQCSHSFVGVEVETPIAAMNGLYGSERLADLPQNDERIQVVCRNCEAVLSIRRSRVGQVVSCKQCSHDIQIKALPEAGAKPVLAMVGSTSADNLLDLATGRGGPFETYEPIRSQYNDFESELEKMRVAHDLLETELARLQSAYDQVKAEKTRLSEQLDAQSRLESDFRTQLELQRSRQSELEAQHRTERENHQSELFRRTAEFDAPASSAGCWRINLLRRRRHGRNTRKVTRSFSRLRRNWKRRSARSSNLHRLAWERLEEELRTLRAEVAAPAETVFESVEFEPMPPVRSLNGRRWEDDLDSVRAEIRTLWREFGNLERYCRSVTNTLDGLGIQIDRR